MVGRFVVVGAIAAATVAAPRAALATGPTAEHLIIEAEEATKARDWSLAADKFRQAYVTLPQAQQRGDLGAHVLAQAIGAYADAYRATEEIAHMERAARLLRGVADANRGALPTVELRAEFERIEGLIEDERAGQRGPGEAAPASAAMTPAAGADNRSADRPHARPDAAGVALVTVGGLFVAGGVGLTAWGALLPGSASEALDERGGTSEEDQAFLDRTRRIGIGAVVGGSVAMALGIGGVAWGAYRLVKPKQDRRVRVSPAASPTTLGLRVRGRF